MATHTPTNTAELKAIIQEDGVTLSAGDVVELELGVTYETGINTETLPSKGLSSPITFKVAGYDNWTRGAYDRVTEADADELATWGQTTGNNSTLWGPHGAGWYEFYGINFVSDDTSLRTTVFQAGLDNTQSSSPFARASMPKLTMRHCVFSQLTQMRIALVLNTGETLIESCAIGPLLKAEETKALAGWSSWGPLIIRNCYLSANSATVLLGGAASIVEPAEAIGNRFQSPSLILQCNHLYADPTWQGTWTMKNPIEWKTGRNVLLEGNVIDGQFVSTNDKSLGVSDHANHYAMARHTYRYNKWVNCESFMEMSNWIHPYSYRDLSMSHNLIITGEDPTDQSVASNELMAWPYSFRGLKIHHNTFIGASDGASYNRYLAFISDDGNARCSAADGLVFRDNILIHTWADLGYLFFVENSGFNKNGLDLAYPNGYTFSTNAISREPSVLHAMPTGNDYYTGGTRVADMLAKLNADYSVKSTQSGTDWNTYASDGGVIGCDIATLEAWIDGVVDGSPTALKQGRHLGMPGIAA